MAEETSQDIKDNKAVAALAYILFFLPLITAKDSPFGKFHANQGLVLLIFGIAANIVLTIIPIIGWILLPFADLFWLVLAIIGIINAVNGQTKPLPMIGGINIIK